MSKTTDKLLMRQDFGLVEARGELAHVHLILLPPSIPSVSSSHVPHPGLGLFLFLFICFLNLGVFKVIVNSQQGGHVSTLLPLVCLGSCCWVVCTVASGFLALSGPGGSGFLLLPGPGGCGFPVVLQSSSLDIWKARLPLSSGGIFHCKGWLSLFLEA